ncbi:MAG: hypothetical protein ACHQC8_02470 [Solirubrobacterales bacterium]
MATPEERIAQIDTDFGARIASAPEADRGTLMLERESAKNAVWGEYRQGQRRAEWIATALIEFPRAPQAAVAGDTLEEVRASAKALHDHFDGLLKAQEEETRKRLEAEAAQRLYGPRPGSAGGNPPPPSNGNPPAAHPFDQMTQRITEIATAHKEGRGVGQVSGVEHDRFIQAIGDTLIQREIFGALPDGREPERPA